MQRNKKKQADTQTYMPDNKVYSHWQLRNITNIRPKKS